MSYKYKDKPKNIRQANDYMLARTLGMFEYTGLPDTIPAKELERIIQTNGFAYITECEGELYAFAGTMGGVMNAYGRPVDIVIANTYLNFFKTLKIDTDGVLMRNDDCYLGVLRLIDKANTMMCENEVSMSVWGINSRIQKTIAAPDDKTKDSAEQYLKRIESGDLAVIGENIMFDGVKVHGGGNSGSASIKEMIEYQQYLKAGMYNELGISSNFNMKRERLLSGEVEQSEDSLFPLVYAMFQNRLEAVAQINEKYGLNITVDFGSVWKLKQVEIERGLDETDSTSDNQGSDSDPAATTITEEVIDDNGDGSEAEGTESDSIETETVEEIIATESTETVEEVDEEEKDEEEEE